MTESVVLLVLLVGTVAPRASATVVVIGAAGKIGVSILSQPDASLRLALSI